MGLAAIKGYLTPVINHVSSLPANIKEQAADIKNDLDTYNHTTFGKVQKLAEQLLDSAALCEGISGIVFVFSAAFLFCSPFSTFAAICSPISAVTTFASAVILYDSHKTYQAISAYTSGMTFFGANQDTQILKNQQTNNCFNTFNFLLKKTWIVEPLMRPYLAKASETLSS